MGMARPVLLVGGAPRVAVDAVRHLTVAATGATAVMLRGLLAEAGIAGDLLLSLDAAPGASAARYTDRAGLESALAAWISNHPEGCVVMSAAVNDYEVAAVERSAGGLSERLAPGAKLASGADEVVIRLRPAGKLIDRLGPEFGLRGPLFGFKYEAAGTVLASAEALRRRVGCAVVAANSLCGRVHALVDAAGSEHLPDRPAFIASLARRLTAAARA
jgi:hypothetical protein